MKGYGLYAKLNDAMVRQADRIGNLREDNAIRNNRSEGTAPVPPEISRANNIMAARGERATQIFFPDLTWHDYRENGFDGIPDLGDFIDVKASEWRGENAALKVKQYKKVKGKLVDNVVDDWAYVLAVGCDHPYWWIVGWHWGSYVRKAEIKWPQTPAFYLQRTELLPIHLLQRFARERAAA